MPFWQALALLESGMQEFWGDEMTLPPSAVPLKDIASNERANEKEGSSTDHEDRSDLRDAVIPNLLEKSY